jgi:hypothetical protein
VNLVYVIQDGQNWWSVVNMEMIVQGSVKFGECVDKLRDWPLFKTNRAPTVS